MLRSWLIFHVKQMALAPVDIQPVLIIYESPRTKEKRKIRLSFVYLFLKLIMESR